MFCFLFFSDTVFFTLTSLFTSESKKYAQTVKLVPSRAKKTVVYLKVAGINCAEYRFIFSIYINAGSTFSVNE